MPIPTDPNKRKYMFSDDMKFLQKIIIYHPSDPKKFLVLKRAAFHPYRPNEWELPGGNVLYGQKHIDSLMNEVKEETGLEVVNITPIDVFTRMEKDFYFLIISYQGKATTDQVTISHEHTDFKWMTKEELLQNESNREFCHFIKKYV